MRHRFVGRPSYSATVVLVLELIVCMPERGKTVPSDVKSMFTFVLFIFSFFVDILEVGLYESSTRPNYYIGTLLCLRENVW